MMVLFLLACLVLDEEVGRALDPDGDDFGPEEDCGPTDATVYPGAEEVCGDGVVNDCSGSEDEARAKCRLQGLMSLAQADLRLVGESALDSVGFSVSNAGDVDLDGRDDLLIGATGLDNYSPNDGGAYIIYYSTQYTNQATSMSPDTSTTKLLGYQDAFAGHSVSGGQDVNGDGRSDLLIGAWHGGDIDQRQGSVHLLLSHNIVDLDSSVVDYEGYDIRITGQYTGDNAGWSTSLVSDVDGDRQSDILVGARYSDLGGNNAGAAYLVLTSSALDIASDSLSLNNADKILIGEAAADEAGFAVTGVDDVDGDGRGDVLIGAPGHKVGEENFGAAYLFLSSGALSSGDQSTSLGWADKKLLGEANGQAGRAVAGAGDVDGDGYSDLLIGAPHINHTGVEEGAAYIVFAATISTTPNGTLSLDLADRKFIGESSRDWAGWSVAGVGDVDGDERGDCLIGAKNHATGGSDAGSAYLLLSSGQLSETSTSTSLSDADLKLVGESAGDYAGYSVSTAGDVNVDGLDDFLIGAPSHSESAGAAYLLFGRSF